MDTRLRKVLIYLGIIDTDKPRRPFNPWGMLVFAVVFVTVAALLAWLFDAIGW